MHIYVYVNTTQDSRFFWFVTVTVAIVWMNYSNRASGFLGATAQGMFLFFFVLAKANIGQQ